MNSTPSKPLSFKIMRNVLFGGLRSLLVAPIPLIVTPLILRKIGVVGYGTWAVFLAINGMTSLADIGLVGTLSKYVAEHHAHGDMVSLRRILDTGLVLFVSLAGVIATGLWILSPWFIAALFHGSSVAKSSLVHLFHIFLIVIASNILILYFASITTGLQRLDLTNVVTASNTVFGSLIGVTLLFRGWGLAGLVFGYAAASVLTLVSYLAIVSRLLPRIRISPRGYEMAEARRLFSFSLRLYLTQAAFAVHNQIEKLLLASFVGVTPAGWYDIASDIAVKIRGAVGLILGPVLPAASELDAQKDERRLSELYYRAHKYLAFCGVPAIAIVGAISSQFVTVWLGPQMLVVALPLAILVTVNFINLTTGPGFLIFAGMGNLSPGVQSASIGIILNVGLSVWLISSFGFRGAVLGTAISLVLASGYFVCRFHAITRYPARRILRESYIKPLVCCAAGLTAVFGMRPAISESWFGLSLEVAAFGAVYITSILLMGFFDKYDWMQINRLIDFSKLLGRPVPIA